MPIHLLQICLNLPLDDNLEAASEVMKPRMMIMAWLFISLTWNTYICLKVKCAIVIVEKVTQ